jgi:hypothetical protein
MAKPGRKKQSAPSSPPGAPEAPPPNKIALTDDQRQVLFFQHKRALEAAVTAKDRAVSDLRNVKKAAKVDLGEHAVEDLEIALKLDTPSGEAAMRAQIERQIRVARWMGADIGQQLDLLDTLPARDWRADGKRAGLAGENATPPDGISQGDGQLWLEGWHEGQAVLVEGFGKKTTTVEGAEPVDDPRPRF